MPEHAHEFVVAVARHLGNRELADKHALDVARSIGWNVAEGFSKAEVEFVANRIVALQRVSR